MQASDEIGLNYIAPWTRAHTGTPLKLLLEHIHEFKNVPEFKKYLGI